ncbi:methyltetrahydrofolate--corrinoid methyltransferase [Desulfobacula toluolica]|uniref:Predicted dihydropteroate synthase n=1 Tax=Desulfobacula toluolica (strain DSM 7467 / Tol2) TaxID=651182 RepID=K0NAE2_DESTT|nr:methyltetrahydrofolate--corrinoid methyltransferase [Desulfobacula toluolica]CCK80999.1 predicted dihydropteroate synthase [Desulfobacula toluolica Tol2]
MFIVIGERINTTLEQVKKAVDKRDAAYITNDVKNQTECGATYIDVNAGAGISHEEEDLKWLIEVVQKATHLPLCIDSPDPKILETAYEMTDKPPIINSISLEKNRFNAMIPFLKGKDCKIIALCMDDSGMPKNSQDIIRCAKTMVKELEDIGIKRDNIFIDPLIQPMSVDGNNGTMVLEAVSVIMKELKGVHTTGGLSNISYGLPKRKIINRSFLLMLMANGFNSAIMDPTDKDLMAALKTGEMIMGNDNFCMNFLKSVRAGEITA